MDQQRGQAVDVVPAQSTSAQSTSAESPADGDLLTDPVRLAAVERLLAAGVESSGLDTLAGLAADLLGASTAQVSLLLDQQVVAAVAGRATTPADRGSPAADSLCTVTMRKGAPLVVPDAGTDPTVSSLPPVASGGVRAYLGVPLVGHGGARLGALCVYSDHARPWTTTDVGVLGRLAGAVVAELELRAVRAELQRETARLDLALGAADIGSFELDPETGTLLWDRRLKELFGYDEASFVPHLDSFSSRVHPDDRDRVAAAIAQTVDGGADLSLEYRIVLPDGRTRWVSARGSMLAVDGPRGPEARLLGAAYDSTVLRHARDQVVRVLETMGDAFYSLDREWRFTYVNAQAEKLLGRARDELLGREIWVEFPDAAGDSPFWRHYQEAMREARTVSFEAYYPAPLDGWYAIRASPTPEGLSVYFYETTDRRRVEGEREAAQARLALVAEMTQALVSTLDVEEAMGRLAGLLVPQHADWVTVALGDSSGRALGAVARHRDPAREGAVERLAAQQIARSGPDSRSAQVLRTGRGQLLSRDEVDTVLGTADSELASLAREAGAASIIVVPLTSRTETLGVLTLARCEGSPAYTQEDLTTAVELGQRAGLVVRNAQLYAAQQQVSETLQRSLLTELPEPDHLEIVARYRPAAAQAAVGGDWYDAAMQPGGGTVLSIGDVMGHDLSATAAMGQVRTLLRGIAFDSGDTPAGVLRRVDAAMRGLQVGTLATAVVARLEVDDGLQAGGLRRLVWSNAGHPPPMLLRADGAVEQVQAAADLLLGLDPGTDRADHELQLHPGDTLLLYTDGLVERRDSPLETGLARLRQALTGRAQVPLQQLCDDVLAALLPQAPDDDIAMVAVRTHPEDRPRPPEAGPNRVPPVG